MVRGFCSVTVSPGGVGKSSLLMVEALAMTTGRPLLGAAPPHPLRVWIWNGEDPAEEVERRIAAACLHYGITAEDIGERLFTDSGRDLPIQIVAEDKAGAQVAAPLVEELTDALRRHCIDVLVIDPFVTSHGVSENDNRAINLVATQYREIADAAGAAVELVHHVRKGPGNDGYTVEDARGAKALIDASRSARVLNPMTEAEAMKAGLESPFGYFRVENGKANMAPRTGTGNRQGSVWRRMANVSLGNESELYPSGDDVGVVETWTWPDALEGIDLTHLAAVQEKLADGDWRESEQANQWAGHAVAEVVGLDVGDWANRTREQKAARARVKVMLRD